MKISTKILALCLALFLGVLAGCGSSTSWVYEYQGERLPAGVYIMNLMSASADAETKVMEAREAEAGEGEENVTTPTQKELASETIDGVSGAQWITNKAMDASKVYFFAQKKFSELGLSLSQEEQDEVEAQVKNMWSNYGDFYEDNGISENSVRLYYLNEQKRSNMFDAIYGTEGEKEVSDDELKKVFEQDYIRVNAIPLSKGTEHDETDHEHTEDEVVVSVEEQNAEAKAKAEAYRDRINEGESYEEILYENLMEQYAGDEEGQAGLSVSEAGSQAQLINVNQTSYYEEGFIDKLKAIAMGETQVVETSTHFFVIQRLDVLEDESGFESNRAQLLANLKTEEYDSWLLEQANAMGIAANDEAIKRYTPDKLKSQQ